MMLRQAVRSCAVVGGSALALTSRSDSKEVPLSYRAPYVAPQSTNGAWLESMKGPGTKAMMGCAINSSSSLCTEICAATGFDFLLIDAQHSAVNPETLRHLLQARHAGGAKAFVRVGGHNDRVGIQQAVDLGADGVLVPCVRTKADVELAVSCCKYPMTGRGAAGGTRSVFVNLRPQLPGGFGKLFEYVHEGNPSVMVAVQIETKDALDNVSEICSVDGLDIAFIGPGDLAVDMGLGRECGVPACWGDPRFVAAVDKVAAACTASGVVGGFWNSGLEGNIPKGFRFFVVDDDVAAMQEILAKNLVGFQEKRQKALAGLAK